MLLLPATVPTPQRSVVDTMPSYRRQRMQIMVANRNPLRLLSMYSPVIELPAVTGLVPTYTQLPLDLFTTNGAAR